MTPHLMIGLIEKCHLAVLPQQDGTWLIMGQQGQVVDGATLQDALENLWHRWLREAKSERLSDALTEALVAEQASPLLSADAESAKEAR